jgi:acyl-CoA thioester hydrolase
MIYYDKEKLYHETKIRVRYADTDRMGYSYYGNYPTYFEVGRTEFLREMGFSYKALEDDGYLLPISKMSIQYHKPALYDELLTIRTIYKKMHSIKVEFEHEVYNEKGELINTASILLVFVSAKTRRPVQGPKYYMDMLDREWGRLAQK